MTRTSGHQGMSMKISGGCHCGAIAYEAEVDPNTVAVCHCTDCQTLSGSAFRVVVPVNRESFRLLVGQPKIYVKTSDSGRERAQSFCMNCGSPIYSTEASNPQTFFIRVGTVQQRAELPPKIQRWCKSALRWAMDLESVPQVAKQ
jgi:hypothetical protein